MTSELVTKDQSNSQTSKCYGCDHFLGELHADDCMIVTREITARLVVDMNMKVPKGLPKDAIQTQLNVLSSNPVIMLNILNEMCMCEDESVYAVLKQIRSMELINPDEK